ncbi:MAG TPA: hypothetical protein VGO55_07950 [Allosphingosinicella sp.]|jgi:hypothetical protein|nr:hypothetical protein [Allosphingosinicella sp.]
MSMPYRFKLKAWYRLLLVMWTLLTLPVVGFVIVLGEAAADAPPRLARLLDMFGGSFALMRPDPLSIALSAWLWLPLVAAPFGLFARTDQE